MNATISRVIRLRSTCASTLMLAALMASAGCQSGSTTTSPSAATTTTTSTVTETMAGVLAPGGSRIYTFSVATAGTVTATLVQMAGADVPEGVIVTLGIGTPSGATCSAGQTDVQVTGSASLPSQVSATEQPGTYCVAIADGGNLFAAASFIVSIEHP